MYLLTIFEEKQFDDFLFRFTDFFYPKQFAKITDSVDLGKQKLNS